MRFTQALATAIVTALPVAYAQTFTSCNPMEKTCPKDVALNSATFKSDFATGSDAEASWSKAAYTTITYDNQGALFQIAKQGQAPTIETNFYFFFGRVDVTMKPGSSFSMNMESVCAVLRLLISRLIASSETLEQPCIRRWCRLGTIH